VPPTSHVDAAFFEGGDGGDLVVSFDVPTRIGAQVFEPSDLFQYDRLPAGTCAAWQLAPTNPAFDASEAGSGIPSSRNAIGASRYGGLTVFPFDVPTMPVPRRRGLAVLHPR
jgi:hypothetical protein